MDVARWPGLSLTKRAMRVAVRLPKHHALLAEANRGLCTFEGTMYGECSTKHCRMIQQVWESVLSAQKVGLSNTAHRNEIDKPCD
jgi:hypothetical protein